MIKKISAICISIASLFVFAVPAFAHVIVTPHQVGVAATQDFTMSVPNEKDNPVVSLRLLMPDGLSSVVPNAIPGWTITTKTNGSGDNAAVTEIDWSGGSIPVGQRAEFVFNAQVPAKQTTLNWKAYQTYSNGTVVSWDIDPATLKNMSDSDQDKMADQQNKGVYSTTTVINDLTGSNADSGTMSQSNSNSMMGYSSKRAAIPLGLSIVAVALSIIALAVALRKK